MAWVVKTSDSFARVGALNGSTLDNALGGSESNTWTDTTTPLWAAASGSASVVNPNQASCSVASSAAVSDSRVTATFVTAANIAMQLRAPGAGTVEVYANSLNLQMYGAGFSGNSAGGYANGDVIMLQAVGTTITVYRNGTLVFTGTANSTVAGYPVIATGGNGGTPKISNFIYEVVGAAVVGPAITIAPPPQWRAVGTGIFARTRFLSSVVAPTRTLNAGSGGFVETGTAATLAAARKLAMAGGAYVESGTAAALRHGYALAAGAGVFTETGTAATLRFGHKIAVGSGAYVLTGTAATLVKSGSVTLAAGSGTYVVAGIGAGLVHGRLLAAAGTSYTETGTAATLTKGPHRLHGVSGQVSVLGKVATMVWSGAPFVRPVAPTTLRIRHAIMNPDGTLIWSDPP